MLKFLSKLSSKSINTHKMKDVKLSAILGREVMVGEQLSAEDLQKIVAAVPDPITAGADASASEEETANQISQAQIDSITQSVTASVTQAIGQKLSGIESRIQNLEDKPGAKQTDTPAVNAVENDGKKEEEESYSTKMAKQMLNQQ